MNSTLNRFATTSTTVLNNKNKLGKTSKAKTKSTSIINSNNRRSIVSKRQKYFLIESKNQQLYNDNNKIKKTNCVTSKFLTKYDTKKFITRRKNFIDVTTEKKDVVLRSGIKKTRIDSNINNCFVATVKNDVLEESCQRRYCENLGFNLSKNVQINLQKEVFAKKTNGNFLLIIFQNIKKNFLIVFYLDGIQNSTFCDSGIESNTDIDVVSVGMLLDDKNDSSSRRLDAVVEAVASAHTITTPSSNTGLLRYKNVNINNTIDNRNINVITPSESSTTSEMTLNSTSSTINTKKRIRSLVNRERRRNICSKSLSLHCKNNISDKINENEIDNVEDEEDEDIGQNQNTDESHDEMEEMEHDDDDDDDDEYDKNENKQNNDKKLIQEKKICNDSRKQQICQYDDEDVIICSKCKCHFTLAQFSFFLEHKIARCQDNKIDINSEHDIIINRQHTPSNSFLIEASVVDSSLPLNSEFSPAVNDSTMTNSSSLYKFTSSNLNFRKEHNDNVTLKQHREIGVDTSDINKGFFLIMIKIFNKL